MLSSLLHFVTATLVSPHAAGVRAAGEIDYSGRAAERTAASVNRAGRVNGAEAERLHADVERQFDRASQRRWQRLAQSKKRDVRRDAYQALAEYVGGGIDAKEQDLKVAKQVLIELNRERSRYSLTREDKQKAEAVMRTSPEAQRIERVSGDAAAQAYVIERLTQANRQIVSRVQQEQAQQKKRQKDREMER